MNIIEELVKETVSFIEISDNFNCKDMNYLEKSRYAFTSLYETIVNIGNKLGDIRNNEEERSTDFLGLVARFIIGDKEAGQNVIIVPDKELISDIASKQAKLPSNVSESYFKDHKEYKTWFIELPQSKLFRYESLYITGIFYLVERNIVSVCFNNPRKKGRINIIDDGHRVRMNGDYQLDDKTTKEIVERARIIAQLTILYYDSKRQADHEFKRCKQAYPEVNKSSKHYGKQRLKYSLFRNIRLEYKGEFKSEHDAKNNKNDKNNKKSNIFNYSFKVRGHFRWQPYGKETLKNKKHKLIWIESFTKCADKEEDTRVKRYIV